MTGRLRTLLISDDDEAAGQLDRLLPGDCEVDQTSYCAKSMRAAVNGGYHLILLDCQADPRRGLQICRGLRAVDGLDSTSVVVLARAEDLSSRLAALEAGADDCLSDSLAAREFMLRLHGAMRRAGAGGERCLSYADLELDPERFKVRRGGKTIHLPTIQFRLLRHLLEHPTIVFSRRELLELVWNDTSIDERTVNVAVVRLRRLINFNGQPNLIRTVPGLGYALDIEADF